MAPTQTPATSGAGPVPLASPTRAADPLQDLELLVRAKYPIIVLDTIETGVAESLIRKAAADLSLHFYQWTRSKGLRRGAGYTDPASEDTQEPHRALSMVERE